MAPQGSTKPSFAQVYTQRTETPEDKESGWESCEKSLADQATEPTFHLLSCYLPSVPLLMQCEAVPKPPWRSLTDQRLGYVWHESKPTVAHPNGSHVDAELWYPLQCQTTPGAFFHLDSKGEEKDGICNTAGNRILGDASSRRLVSATVEG